MTKIESFFLILKTLISDSILFLIAIYALLSPNSVRGESLATIETKALPTEISPALNALISQTLMKKKYRDAIKILDNEIQKSPNNTELLYKKASIYADIDQYNKSLDIVNQIIVLQPDNAKAKQLRITLEKVIQAQPHNEVGFDQGASYISDIPGYWLDSSVYYYRLANNGKFGARVNYAHRYGTTGKQFQLEAYPKLFPGAYASLTAAYTNTTQFLYANLQYRIEGFFSLPHDFDFSLGQYGQQYIRFGHKKILTYTGSLGKSIGNYYLSFRPSYYTPVTTTYYEIDIQRFFSDANNYVSFQFGAGKLPDIGDLPPFDQLININQKSVSVRIQTSLTKTAMAKLGVGYYHQKLPSGLTRDITGSTVSLVWLF